MGRHYTHANITMQRPFISAFESAQNAGTNIKNILRKPLHYTYLYGSKSIEFKDIDLTFNVH